MALRTDRKLDENTNINNKSETPKEMYCWRVAAMENWISEHGGKMDMETLCEAEALDQYHYFGVEANEEMQNILEIKSCDRYLDVGSGIGGVGRWLNWKTGCGIIGIDVQKDLVEEANKVTEMVGLNKEECLFVHMDGTDSVEFKKEFGPTDNLFGLFDGFYSHLVFLHIPLQPRLELFRNCFYAMKGNGESKFFIEDYVVKDARNPITEEDYKALKEIVGVMHLPTKEEYIEQLISAGQASGKSVEIIEFDIEKTTDSWSKWTQMRSDQFVENKENHIKMHGREHAEMMEIFYKHVANLFAGKKLGGCRIIGKC